MKFGISGKGFTIVELMTIIAVLGIIGSIAIPAFRGYIPRMRLRAARDEVLATLRLARTKAFSEGQVYKVIFTPPNRYKIDPGGETKLLPNGVSIAEGFDIAYIFYPQRTAEKNPNQTVTIINAKNDSVQFHLIEATGYITIVE